MLTRLARALTEDFPRLDTLVPSCAAAGPVFNDVNLFNPPAQVFPGSEAAVAALGWSTNIAAGWACQDAAGSGASAIVNPFVGGSTFQMTALSSSVKCLTGQVALGLDDGAGFNAQKCIELYDGSDARRFQVASSATFDKDWTTPWSVLVVFRCPNPQAGSRSVIGKYSGGGGGGWLIYLSSGSLFAYLEDQGVASLQAAPTGSYADGAWHWAYARYNPSDDTVRMDTDLSTGSSAGAGAVVDISNSGNLSMGGHLGSNGLDVQIRGALVWNDVSTPVAAIQAWWKLSTKPNILESYTAASLRHTLVDDHATEGDQLASWATGQVAWQYSALHSTSPRRLGLYVNNAWTNLVPSTDLNVDANWVNTGGGTKTNFARDSARRYREAVKHSGTGVQSVLCSAANGAATTAATVYTGSVWCFWDGTGTAPELEIYRADGTTLLAEVSASVANKWRRLQVSFTSAATEVVRIAVKGRDGNAWFFGPMVNTDTFARGFIPTFGAAGSTTVTVPYARVTGLRTNRGTIQCWCVLDYQDNNLQFRSPFGVLNAAGSANYLKHPIIVADETARADIYTSAGVFSFSTPASAAQADWSTKESEITMWWDRAETNGWSVRLRRRTVGGGSFDASTNTDIPAGDAASEIINVGLAASGAQLDGSVSRIRAWVDRVELAA